MSRQSAGRDDRVGWGSESGLASEYAHIVSFANALEAEDWLTLQEVFRRHCRTPVADADLEALIHDLRASFPESFDTDSTAFTLLMVFYWGPEEGSGLLAAEGDSDTQFSLEAVNQIDSLKSRFGVRLRHIIELPLRGARDWVRLHAEDLRILSGNVSPEGTLRTRVGIELRDGSVLRLECPPTSLVNLCSMLFARVADWDRSMLGEVSDEAWERLESTLREVAAIRQAVTPPAIE